MKILKIIGKILLILLIISILFIAFFYIKNESYLESPTEENLSYLRENKKVINDKNENQYDLTGFFDQDFYDSNVFLLGENHGFAEVQNIDFELFKHLNQKIGIRYYIAEMDSIRSKRLNQYLNDSIKNNSLLRSIVVDIEKRIPQQSSKQLFEKWEKIYDYNKTLSYSDKIEVLGIDKDFDDDSRKLSRDSIMISNFINIIEELLNSQKDLGFYQIELHTDDNVIWEEIPSKVKINIYRIIQEALNNIQKHSHATEALIEIRNLKNLLILHIRDNGIGFDSKQSKQGIGLKNMEVRVSNINGEISFNNIKTGAQIIVSIKYP
jgi:hypothetical protein